MDPFVGRISMYVEALCRYPNRHPGRPGNRAGTELFTRTARSFGWTTEVTELDCLDWEPGTARVAVGSDAFELHVGPYSKAFEGSRRLAVASTVEELEAGGLAGSILLVRGALCREQLTPKGFTYYEPPEHRRIVAALEGARPAAVVAATGHNPDYAGAPYPFPWLEDADVEIPNAYLTDIEGEPLAAHVGEHASLRIESRRIPARLEHVVARLPGSEPGRIVVFGHVDTKPGTPGALDNATGTAVLLGVAELLAGIEPRHTVELVPVNGEDYYASTGEKQFERENEGRWDEIVLGLNADGAGWRGKRASVSLFCDGEIEAAVRASAERRRRLVIGEPWYQSDHGLFLLHGRPALAVTSEDAAELLATICHTEADTPELVDPETVADVARFFADLACSLP